MRYRLSSRLLRLSLALLLLLPYTASVQAAPSSDPLDPALTPPPPNYNEASGWLSRPENPNQYPVDLFWAYPTILHDDQNWLMDPDDSALRQAAATTLTNQASVFSGQANIYSPVYRQVNMAALTLPEPTLKKVFSPGQDDLRAALAYYLKHDNNGRPFILAGHSQGSYRLLELAKENWGDLKQHQQLVAAYLIGWSIIPEDLTQNPAIRICEQASQTGCFITYNSVAPTMQSQAPTLKPDTWVVNPMTWRTDSTLAPAEDNLGAVFFNADGSRDSRSQFASAQIIDNGLVVITKDKGRVKSDSPAFPNGVYHIFDYSLFYKNLRANINERIQAFSRL